MKKAGTLLKVSFVAMATIAFSSAAFAQAAEIKPGKSTSQAVTQKSSARGASSVTAEESKVKIKQENDAKVIAQTPERNCVSKSTLPPNSITRKNFDNLPKDRQQFILDNSAKYTIVD
jgi:hypothetical protein